MISFAHTLHIISFSLHTILTGLLCVFAICLTLGKLLSFQFALAAAAADAINLFFFTYATIWLLRRPEYPRKNFIDKTQGFFAFIVWPAIGYAVTVLFLIMMQFEVHSPAARRLRSKMIIGNELYYLLDITWGVLAASVLASVGLIINCRKDEARELYQQEQPPRYTLARISPTWSPPSPLSFHGVGLSAPSSSPYLESGIDSSAFANTNETLHSTTTKVIRSVTSRTKLAARSSMSESEFADDGSINCSRGDFSTPLSSPVSFYGHFDCKLPPAANAMANLPLETIPDSCDNSPEKALGWPFNADLGSSNRASLTDSLPGTAPPSSPPPGDEMDWANLTSSPPSKGSSSPMPEARAPLGEQHIHPLFRSDSPLPPPTTTPSSSVTASAFGGKYITSTALARVRARSVPASDKHVTVDRLPRSTENLRTTACNLRIFPTSRVVVRSRSMEATKFGRAKNESDENIPPVPALPSQRTSTRSNSPHEGYAD